MGSIGFDELLLIFVVAILVYGKDLPKMARKVGRWYSAVKRQISDIQSEIARQIPDDDELQIPPGGSEPDPPGHADPSPSPPLPGPDPADPEYKAPDGPFDPAKPTGSNGHEKPQSDEANRPVEGGAPQR